MGKKQNSLLPSLCRHTDVEPRAFDTQLQNYCPKLYIIFRYTWSDIYYYTALDQATGNSKYLMYIHGWSIEVHGRFWGPLLWYSNYVFLESVCLITSSPGSPVSKPVRPIIKDNQEAPDHSHLQVQCWTCGPASQDGVDRLLRFFETPSGNLN